MLRRTVCLQIFWRFSIDTLVVAKLSGSKSAVSQFSKSNCQIEALSDEIGISITENEVDTHFWMPGHDYIQQECNPVSSQIDRRADMDCT